MNSLSNRKEFLHAAAADLRDIGRRDIGENPIFSRDVQELDGFRLAFMNQERFEELCARYKVDPKSSEAIMMQARMTTRAHVHNVGDSLFLPLGPAEGFHDAAGGTYIGEYRPDQRAHDLSYVPAVPGETFHVPAGQIHFFQPEKGANFSAIACVSPRIQRPDGTFDITHFSESRLQGNPQFARVS